MTFQRPKAIIVKILLTILLFITQRTESQTASSFSGFIQHLSASDSSARTALVDSFMTAQAQKGFPVTEDSVAHFVFRGSVGSSIIATGDHTQWSSNNEAMTNVSGTDFYYRDRKFEPDARMDYKFIKDGNWILDPLNKYTVTGGFGPNSELAMPMYAQPLEIQYDPTIPHGSVSSLIFTSNNTGNTRTIKIYLPPNYDSSSLRYSTIYVHDGPDYLSLGSMATVIDNLIAGKKIEPIIAVFVPPGADRASEYRLGTITQFTNLMVKELIPYVDSAYRTDPRPERRATMGSSDGGHIALYLAVNYSNFFGLVGGQSSTITDLFRTPIYNGPKVPVRFYLDVGTYDLSYQGATFLELNRGFRDLLISNGYTITYAEYHEGHSWGNWRAHIDDILKTFFPFTSTGVTMKENEPREFELFSAYPNPFNPTTTIQYELTKSGRVNLILFTLEGKVVETLVEENESAGLHSVRWDASRLPSGIYFCRLEAWGRTMTQRILLLK
jgi:enterochelin esterase family protein